MPRGAPQRFGVKLKLGIVELSGEWEPNDVERAAAWELYVELVTRVSVVPLDPAEGSLREALTSLHSIFATTREILRRHGPGVAEAKPSGQYNFAFLALTILHSGLRPLLTHWHPALSDWEAQRAGTRSTGDHERAWPDAPALRVELEIARKTLVDYTGALATACGIPNLLEAIPVPSASASSAGGATSGEVGTSAK